MNFSFQASEELEDRQSLAVMAASGQDEVTGPDGETFIEKYTRGVSAVETILTLDRFVFETSKKTQFCIKGLLVVRDFCFSAVCAAGPVHKKKVGGRL